MTSFSTARRLVIAALFVPFMASAQTAVFDGDPMPESVAAPAGTVSCFDYYHFGSVQAQLTTQVSGTVTGTPIAFSGTLRNANPYPIVDGTLYVKVFRARSVSDANGPDVVDQFVVKSDIAIPANSSVPVSFSWQVPSYAASGEYSIATFFTTSRKFNLLGLSFTDDVVGNTVPFTVSSETDGIVTFDKTQVTIGGVPYFFAAYPPRVSATDPVAVAASVKNSTDSAQKATVRWEVYQWDAMLRENVVQEQSATISVPPHGTAPVTLTIKDAKYPVYLAVGTLQWNDAKSIINVRFVREGADRLRINFPGIISYPLKVGEQNTIFSCLHNSGASDVVHGGKLELTVSDMSGNPIHTYTYTGDVTGAMMGVADSFVPTRTYDSFMIDARLYDAHGFVDEAHLVYDCAALGRMDCPNDDSSAAGFDFSQTIAGVPFMNLIIGAGVLLLLVLLIALRKMLTRI